LAIHASKGFPRDCESLCHRDPFVTHLIDAGFNKAADLPRGAILAVVELIAVVQTEKLNDYWDWAANDFARTYPEERERAFGDFSERRYGWLTRNVRALRAPIPCRGALGLWTPPPLVLAEIQRQLRSAA
jgi:hypothetical protein